MKLQIRCQIRCQILLLRSFAVYARMLSRANQTRCNRYNQFSIIRLPFERSGRGFTITAKGKARAHVTRQISWKNFPTWLLRIPQSYHHSWSVVWKCEVNSHDPKPCLPEGRHSRSAPRRYPSSAASVLRRLYSTTSVERGVCSSCTAQRHYPTNYLHIPACSTSTHNEDRTGHSFASQADCSSCSATGIAKMFLELAGSSGQLGFHRSRAYG